MKEQQRIASLFNLIVYCERDQHIDFFNNIIKTIISKFPCKIIFIKAEPDAQKDSLEFEPTKVKLEDKDSGIECEEINITVFGKALERVPFLILSHLAPDLPTYLLWGKDPAKSNPVLPSIEKIATHLVMDSEYAEDLHKFSNKMLEWKDRTDCRIIDMNWVRFSGWRHVLLQTYDTPDRVEELRNSDRIVIKYNGISTQSYQRPEVQAVYLQAWLASQLGWRVQMEQTDFKAGRFAYDYCGHSLFVELNPVEEKTFSPGSILGFESIKNDRQTQLKRKQESPEVIFAEISSNDICQLPFTIPLFTMTRGLSFVKELLYTPASDHYYRMLEVLAEEI